MSNECHGPTGIDVYQAIEAPRLNLPLYGRYAISLLLAIAIHAFILRLAGYYLLNADSHRGTAKPKTLHLKLSPSKSTPAQPRAQRNPATSSQTKKTKKPEKAAERDSAENQIEPSDPTTGVAPEPPTATRILATAKDLTQKMAEEDKTESKPVNDPISSAIERALNPQREPPGVTELADGTVRVVTQHGLVYCIRPKDDPGIAGPEDAISLAVSCY